MTPLGPRITFTAAAVPPLRRPSLPRSGACCAPLPSWHAHEVIMLGGYTEAVEGARDPGGAASVVPGTGGGGTAGAAGGGGARLGPRRAPTMEAWTFSSEDGGHWHPLTYAEGSAVPQPRLTSQAALVGDEVWLVGGWDPSAPPDTPQFLNDVWALDLRTRRWRRVEVAGEEVPRISRFAMASLPGGLLLLHTHRCGEDVLLLDTATSATTTTTTGSGIDAAAAAAAGPRDSGPGASAGGGEGSRGAAAAATAERGAAPGASTLRRLPLRGVFPGGQSPPSRGLHSLTLAAAPPSRTAPDSASVPPAESAALLGGGVVAGSALYVYGGAPQSGPMYGDLWALDLESMTWRELAPEGPVPQARCSHVAAAASGCPKAGSGPGGGAAGRYLVVIGGSYYAQPGRLQPLDDVAVYDTQTNRWVEAKVEGPRPSPRNAAILAPLRRASAACGEVEASEQETGDRFVLHGGWRPFVESYNDTYIVTVT